MLYILQVIHKYPHKYDGAEISLLDIILPIRIIKSKNNTQTEKLTRYIDDIPKKFLFLEISSDTVCTCKNNSTRNIIATATIEKICVNTGESIKGSLNIFIASL
jgi:hypothetical protein